MPYPLSSRVLRTLAGIAAVSLLATGCGDDPPAVDDEPDTTRIVLTIGTGTGAQTVTWITDNGAVSPATITIPPNATRAVTAQFLRADNSVDPIITPERFRLDFNVVSGTGVTITKNGNLAATIAAGATAGQSVILTLVLFHLGDAHDEYASSPGALTVRVQ